MERALLEGEHQMEMEELEKEQQIINRLKHRQLELIDQAQAERDKVRPHSSLILLFCYNFHVYVPIHASSIFQTCPFISPCVFTAILYPRSGNGWLQQLQYHYVRLRER